jgi:hypothetical protein
MSIDGDDTLLPSVPRVDLDVLQLEAQLVVCLEAGVAALYITIWVSAEYVVPAEDPSKTATLRSLLRGARPPRCRLAVKIVTPEV